MNKSCIIILIFSLCSCSTDNAEIKKISNRLDGSIWECRKINLPNAKYKTVIYFSKDRFNYIIEDSLSDEEKITEEPGYYKYEHPMVYLNFDSDRKADYLIIFDNEMHSPDNYQIFKRLE